MKIGLTDDKLSEETTCLRYINPKLMDESKWDLDKIVRNYTITNGKIIPDGRSGKRAEALFADYVLLLGPNYPIAVIEAK